MKRIISLILALVMLLALCSCGKKEEEKHYDPNFYEEYPTGEEIVTVKVRKNPHAVITLADNSEIEIELCYDVAPNAVANFIAFANENIYDKMGFTQIKNNCIVMTDTMEGEFEPPYYVQDEVQKEEIELSHVRGTVSMIRMSKSNSLTGQFFILTEDQTHFDKNFTAFGTVVRGLGNVDKLISVEKDEDGMLISPVGIKDVTIKTYGAEIPRPTIIIP